MCEGAVGIVRTPASDALSNELESAIDWMVLLSSGDVAPSDRVRFERWRVEDPRHGVAWEAVSSALQGTFRALGEGDERAAARAVLSHPPARRRVLRAMVVLALTAGGVATVVDRQVPLRTLSADFRTGTGERRAMMLSDGSELTLNARSAVNLSFSDSERRIHLRAGSVYVRVASDAARPFIVASEDGEVQALGTIFSVTRNDAGSIASVVEHSVHVRAAGQQTVLLAGEGVLFSTSGLGKSTTELADAAAWHGGMLVVHNEPLGTVIEALRAYRRGIVRITPAAARLRVLGAFHLDDTDRTLESLRQTLPIHISALGPWFVSIDVRHGATNTK